MADKKKQQKGKSFHSAVNCIPVLRPPSHNTISKRPKGRLQNQFNFSDLPSELEDFLCDSLPSSLDHLQIDTYTGSIRLSVEVMTAVIFGNQKRHEGKPTEISIPIDPSTGMYFIPPTMIKGMISNAYERLTASRFRVFDDHSVSLTYRADPAAALQLVPIKLSDDYDQGNHQATLLYGPDRTPYARILTHEKIENDETDQDTSIPLLEKSKAWNILQHGKLVDFMAKKIGDTYIVTQIKAIEDDNYFQLKLPDWVTKYDSNETPHKGWFYSTTPDELLKAGKSLINSKFSERIFFCDEINNVKIDDIRPPIVNTYDQIIQSYSYDSTSRSSKMPPKERSRFIVDRHGSEEIGPISHGGLLAYARLDKGNVVELMPTQVGRRTYSSSPRSLALKQRVLPPTRPNDASPADRTFGFILKDAHRDSGQENIHTEALRGRISITAIDTRKAVFNTTELHLRPLMSPNASSARRFLTDSSGSTISGHIRSTYYSEGDMLGAASYPFRRKDAEPKRGGDGRLTYAMLSAYQEQLADENPNKQIKHNQEIYSIAHSWIERGSVLHCLLRFEGLTREELWTLLWVVDSKTLGKYAQDIDEQRVHDHTEVEGFLRLGMGKPLGLGVVRISPSMLEVVKTARGEDPNVLGLIDDYTSLKGCMGAPDSESYELNDQWRDKFLKDADSFYEALSTTPWTKAFLRACIGYPGTSEVRYMTLKENVKNNKTTEDGTVAKGYGVAPRSLAADNWYEALTI